MSAFIGIRRPVQLELLDPSHLPVPGRYDPQVLNLELTCNDLIRRAAS